MRIPVYRPLWRLFLIALALALSPASAETIRVPGDFPTIQAGIDASGDGDIIVVADGTYTGSGNRNIDLQGKSITLRSARGAEHCVIDCQQLDRGFVIQRGESADCVIEGFTVCNGWVKTGTKTGQGILIKDSSPTFRACTITRCGYFYSGDDWSPRGGGIAVEGGNPRILGCLIKNNQAGYGGGIFCLDARPRIIGCRIQDNLAVSFYEPGIIYGNYIGDGGGIYLEDCNGALCRDCLIINNLSFSETADPYGGGIKVLRGTGLISNCTFCENQGRGDIVFLLTGSYELSNTIVWYSNSTYVIIEQKCRVTVHHCDIGRGHPGAGNIDQTPCFRDPAGGDYALDYRSPCIDAGEPENIPAGIFEDIDRSSRLLDGDLDQDVRIDMGAFEYSNVSLSMKGSPQPGATMQLRVEGSEGLWGAILGGFRKADPPLFYDPFGYLLVELEPALTPLVPILALPETVDWTIPTQAKPGQCIYLLPICWDSGTGAGNLGAFLPVVIQ